MKCKACGHVLEPKAGEWSPAEERRLRSMWDRGKNDAQIAVALGRTVRAVALKRYKLGIRTCELPTQQRGGSARPQDRFGARRGGGS